MQRTLSLGCPAIAGIHSLKVDSAQLGCRPQKHARRLQLVQRLWGGCSVFAAPSICVTSAATSADPGPATRTEISPVSTAQGLSMWLSHRPPMALAAVMVCSVLGLSDALAWSASTSVDALRAERWRSVFRDRESMVRWPLEDSAVTQLQVGLPLATI